MTEAQYREIWDKTNGHCHFCGDPVSLRKRGYRRDRADGCWEADHVVQRDKAGISSIANYLPACTPCNRLRWHRKGAAIRDLLLLGLIARREVDTLTETGKSLIRLRSEQSRRTARRRSWISVARVKLKDPVLIERNRQANRQALITFLRKHLKRRFTAAELSKHTGVPKKWVRRLLEASYKINITRNGRGYLFQCRPPKKRAR